MEERRIDKGPSWITAGLLIFAQFGSVVYFVTNTNAATNNLTVEVHQLGVEVSRLALANERTQEHARAQDYLIEQLQGLRK